MAPSALITLPPPLAAPAFGSSDRLGLQSNGHSLGSTQKLPGKSNLKQPSTIPSTSHSGNGSSSLEGKDARFGDTLEEVGERCQGNGEKGTKVQWTDNYGKDLTQVFEFEPRVVLKSSVDDRAYYVEYERCILCPSEEGFLSCELALAVFLMSALCAWNSSDSDDSEDDDDDSDSSQACTCVIQ